MKPQIDYQSLIRSIKGCSIPKPLSGTLSGHAAGEPFEKKVYELLKQHYPNQTFKQFEYLNDLYRKNPSVIGYKARQELFDSPSVMFLLQRGKDATDNWSINHPFEEKQNDTADILIAHELDDHQFYELLDVKTRNIDKKAQAPNVISSYKLAQLCANMIDNHEFDRFSLNYLEIDWFLAKNELVCTEAHAISLFKIDPTELYINWAAATQIQFHVSEINPTYDGNIKDWCYSYLTHFVIQAKRRAHYMLEKYVQPFEKYLDIYTESQS